MSNFIYNLAQRGAGLAPTIKLQPSVTPRLTPDLDVVQTNRLEPETVPVEEATPEVPTQSEAAPSDTPPETTEFPTTTDLNRLTAPVQSEATSPPAPPEELQLPTNADFVGQTPPNVATRPRPEGEVKRSTSPMFLVKPKGQIPVGDVPEPRRPIDSKPDLPSEPLPARARVRPREQYNSSFETLETEDVETQASVHTRPAPLPHEVSEPKSFAKIEPATSHQTAEREAMVRSPSVQLPEFKESSKANVTSSESRSVQVRIGTIEVRATTPSPPAQAPVQTPKGFDDYGLVRNYINWKED